MRAARWKRRRRCRDDECWTPVPHGFTITTETCNAYYESGKQFPQGLWQQVQAALKIIEQLFSKIALDTDPQEFEQVLHQYKEQAGVKTDAEISAADLKKLVVEFKQIAERQSDQPFPTDVYEQLKKAIEAVFSSWNNKRAIDYRNFNKIPHNLGTSVNVQSMVFGNMGNDNGTGVAFMRNPSTGEKKLYGEYLLRSDFKGLFEAMVNPGTGEGYPVVIRLIDPPLHVRGGD